LNEAGAGAVRVLLHAARELDEEALDELIRRLMSEAAVRDNASSVPVDPVERATTSIRRVAAALGRQPATTDYLEAYRSHRGTDAALVSLTSILRLFGTWPLALEAAGITAGNTAARKLLKRNARVARYSDERLVESLQACARDLGWSPSVIEYIAWRDSRIGGGPGRRALGTDIPHWRTIQKRFGSWLAGRTAAGLAACSRERAGERRYSSL
jgi:hypothetical protein